MKIKLSVPEFLQVCKAIRLRPERIFKMIRSEIREAVGHYLNEMMKGELTEYLGRQPYERKNSDGNHRNGGYHRSITLKGIGTVGLDVPRDRKGLFKSLVIPRSKQIEEELRKDICLMFLTGISTRTLSMISSQLIGRRISHSQVSLVSKELIDAVEQWRERDLSAEKIKYLFVDGVCFKMRVAKSVENVPVLVVIGVNEFGQRMVLGLQAGDKESATCWREFFKDLKRRGLDGRNVQLGVMDGLPGLERIFTEEFPKAKIQRCQVHVAKNVLAKVPMKLKQEVADDVRTIFYASSRKKAMEYFEVFQEKWRNAVPSAVKCLERSIENCLTFFHFPKEDWICLRTSNIIERLNKEFKRRTKPMEIVAGERACYTLLAFICLKMELHWSNFPMGKRASNLPVLQNLELANFTQSS
ncbi:MAG: IS256 family transposase [Candidatus Aminicenantes bacterium]|nr:IS256 family transposase [Candidatus Aminicenantes bacterium]